jgi:coenzyme F420-reducing hydrogenase alpha subunit
MTASLEAHFDVVEPNRFFEAILRGRNAEEVCHLASRICGICAVSHSCAALLATEKALGLEITEQTFLLRRLVMNAEAMSSHALHVLFLAAPDFVGLPSVMPLVTENPELVQRAFRIKVTGYQLGEVVLGRHTHPVTAVPGGYTEAPQAWRLAQMAIGWWSCALTWRRRWSCTALTIGLHARPNACAWPEFYCSDATSSPPTAAHPASTENLRM